MFNVKDLRNFTAAMILLKILFYSKHLKNDGFLFTVICSQEICFKNKMTLMRYRLQKHNKKNTSIKYFQTSL